MATMTDGPTHNETGLRVWRACINCRKKKIKCDGKDPCISCSKRAISCEYPTADDNASKSRQNAHSIDQKLDMLIKRMEAMEQNLSSVVEKLNRFSSTSSDKQHATEAPVVSSLDEGILHYDLFDVATSMQGGNSRAGEDDGRNHCEMDLDTQAGACNPELAMLSQLLKDRRGISRHIGGTSNMLALEAMADLGLPSGREHDVSQHSTPISPALRLQPSRPFHSLWDINTARPLFQPPDDTTGPIRYVSDLLINLFFQRLNTTFPILHHPTFTAQHQQYLSTRSKPNSQSSGEFLSVLFAVYACASNLIPQERRDSQRPPGIEYFEKSMSYHRTCYGRGGVGKVQCLVILAMCSAAWGQLTESWSLAGRAVRAAQDIGLHINFEGPSNETVDVPTQLNRRVWWCAYCIDILLSTCLGRQSISNASDADCALPEDVYDDDLELQSNATGSNPAELDNWSPLTGFIPLIQVCQILDKINRAAPLLTTSENSETPQRISMRRSTVFSLDVELTQWIKEKLPPSIQFAANNPDQHDGIHLTMCVLTFMLHAISNINLYSPLTGDWESQDVFQTGDGGEAESPTYKCVNAARGIIKASELVITHVAPSHYLAFCVHLLCLSGIFLLRSSSNTLSPPEIIAEVEHCIQRLGELQKVFPSAEGGKTLLAELLRSTTSVTATSSL